MYAIQIKNARLNIVEDGDAVVSREQAGAAVRGDGRAKLGAIQVENAHHGIVGHDEAAFDEGNRRRAGRRNVGALLHAGRIEDAHRTDAGADGLVGDDHAVVQRADKDGEVSAAVGGDIGALLGAVPVEDTHSIIVDHHDPILD